MKKILIILSVITASSIAPTVVGCGINSEINHDVFHPNNPVVNLQNCQSLVSEEDLTYSFITVTKQEVRFKIFTRLKYNIRDLSENDYDVDFQNQKGESVEPINIVNNYNVVLNAKKESQLLTGTLTLNLSVVDDRINIEQINYDQNKWFLTTRNKVADLFNKFEMAIYLAVQDNNYQLGAFLEIKIQHNGKIYTNDDENNQEVLDVTDHYLISASTQSSSLANRYINGNLSNLEIKVSDERRSVKDLTNKLFKDYHPNNLYDNGKTLYKEIRNLINKFYTLDSLTESDFDLTITSQGVKLENNESKLTSLSYEVIIDASNSRYIKDVNPDLTITIIDKVIHLDQLTIDWTPIQLDVATKAQDLKTKLFEQISLAADDFPAVEQYLIVNLTQNGAVVTDEKYLEPGEVQISVKIDEEIARQPFGGSLNLNFPVVDNRINLKDPTTAELIKTAIISRGYSILDNFGQFKESILVIFQQLTQESSPKISKNIKLDEDLIVKLEGYEKDDDLLKESADVTLLIQAKDISRYIKNNLGPLKIKINFARCLENPINVIEYASTEFVDYDDLHQLHALSQINATTIAIYVPGLMMLRYQFSFSPEVNAILDYKVSADGKHDFWVMQTKISDNNWRIDYYIDGQQICTNNFEASGITASINKYSQSLYLRTDTTTDRKGIGPLYRINSKGGISKVDLSQIFDQPLAIDLIRSADFGQEFIQSKNKIYLIDERIYTAKLSIKEYDISNDYFFDYNNHQILELKEDGLYINDQLIPSRRPNSNLLYKDNAESYKFTSNFAVDESNNFYYLYRDFANHTYSVVKNQEVILTVNDKTSFHQSLKVWANGIWELTVGAKIYTNERKEN